MARPGRPERNKAARSFRQLRRFHHVINWDKVFGTHNGRIDVGFGRLRFGDAAITQKVVSQERLIAAIPTGHPLLESKKALKLRHIAQEPFIIYPNAPRPSYADQVLSFYSDQGLEPVVAFEVGEMQTALGLVAAGGGICLIPASVRQLARDNVAYVDLD